MRIISKFHDYYDVLNDGSDTDHVWKRETSSFLPDLNDPFYKTDNWENDLPHLLAEVSVPRFGSVYLILYKNFLLTLMAESHSIKKPGQPPLSEPLKCDT